MATVLHGMLPTVFQTPLTKLHHCAGYNQPKSRATDHHYLHSLSVKKEHICVSLPQSVLPGIEEITKQQAHTNTRKLY